LDETAAVDDLTMPAALRLRDPARLHGKWAVQASMAISDPRAPGKDVEVVLGADDADPSRTRFTGASRVRS
jgi:hypothetical protein